MHRPTQRRDALRERVFAGRQRRNTQQRRAAAARKGSRRLVALLAALGMVAGVLTVTQLSSSAFEWRGWGGAGDGGSGNECEVTPTPTEEAVPEEGSGAEGADAEAEGADAEAEGADAEAEGADGGQGGEFSASDTPTITTSQGQIEGVWMNGHWHFGRPSTLGGNHTNHRWGDRGGDNDGDRNGGRNRGRGGDGDSDGDDPSDGDCQDDGDGDGTGGDTGDGGDGDGGDGTGDGGDGDGGDGTGDGGDGDGDGGDGDGGDGITPPRTIQSCDESDLPPHDGFQSAEERCIATQQGEQSALENNPQLLFTEFPNQVAANEPFQYTVSTQNLVRNDFPAAGDGGYYQRPAALNEEGLTQGHFHTGCRQLPSFDAAPEPNQAADFFIAVQDGGGGAEPDFVTIDVPGLEAGLYQCMAWAGSGNHSVPAMAFAQGFIAVDTFRLVVE